MGEKGQRKEYSLKGECDICISGDTTIAVRLPKGREYIDDKTVFGGKKEIHSDLGKSRRYMSSKDGEVVIHTDSWSRCSVEMGESDIRTADPTTSTVMQTWSKEGLLMEETSFANTAIWSDGKFDIHHDNEYKTRLSEIPFAYRYEHTNYLESQQFETGTHKHIGYYLADIDRNPSELNGTEEFKSKEDVAEWYELQNKENFWKKLSEKAIAIVNLARNYVHDSIFKTTIRNDIEQYCGDRVVDASTFASMYKDNANLIGSTEMLNAIQNTIEPEEQGLQQEEQEGEEH